MFNNLLVTGGCGFIGTNFIRYLFSRKDFSGRIINADKLTYAGNPKNLADIEDTFKDRYVFVRVDISDPGVAESLFSDYSVDAVCHLAAESHVDRSITSPEPFIKSNIIGTFRLLEAARSRGSGLKLFHHVSTDEVYGSLGKTGRFTEKTPYDPSSPYSASKAASDHLVMAYHRTYGLPVTISNCSNNYGPYQYPEKLIPLMIINALEGKPLPVYGDGKNIRDWLYVEDHCAAIWEIMMRGRRGQTYNIGGDAEMTNLSVVEAVCDLVDRHAGSLAGLRSRRQLIRFVVDRPGHDRRYAMDFSKIRSDLGWQPKESFTSGLEKTVLWYLQNRKWVESIRTGEYLQWIKSHYGGI